MRVMRRRDAERAKNLNVLGRVRQMIFTADDVRDFHLHVVDHIDEMKNPRSIGATHSQVRVRSGIRQVKIDFAANDIINHDVLARRTKSQRALIFEDVTGILQLFQVALVKFGPFALQIRSKISADVWTLIPIQPEPLQPFVDCRHGFIDVARSIGIFYSQNEFSALMPGEQPIEKRRARAPDVEITGRRWGKADADLGIHCKINLATDYADKHRFVVAASLCWPGRSSCEGWSRRSLRSAPAQHGDTAPWLQLIR